MVDLHIHILPGLDDGASSWNEAMDMAVQALDSNVFTVVATSHGNLPGHRKKDEITGYKKVFEKFSRRLEWEGLELNVVPGMEVFADGPYIDRIKNGELLTIGGTSYVLVEFPMDCPARNIYFGLNQMFDQGFSPILAHPERYICVQKVPAHVQEWHEMGTVIQVNKDSRLGGFGRKIQRTAHSLLRHRLADVVASDAHSPWDRTPEMARLESFLAGQYGRPCSGLLLSENPERILQGKDIFREKVIPYDCQSGEK